MLIDLVIIAIGTAVIFYSEPIFAKHWLRVYERYNLSKRCRKFYRDHNDSSDREESSVDNFLKGENVTAMQLLHKLLSYNKELEESTKNLLVKAGKRDESAFERFVVKKIFVCIFSIFLLFMLYIMFFTSQFSLLPAVIGVIVFGGYIGHVVSQKMLESEAASRQKSIERGMGDVLALFLICSESGLDVAKAIRRIAKETRASHVAIADELSMTAIELDMISDSHVVFQNMADRTDCDTLKVLAKTIEQSIEYGSSLTQALRDLMLESRQRCMMLAEEKAAKVPTMLTLPMMVFILPCLFIVMLGPVIVQVKSIWV